MAGRGELTPLITALSKELLGYEIDTVELRLMPYVQFRMMNERTIDPMKINEWERVILEKWKIAGRVTGKGLKIRITREFWYIINTLLWHAYVNYDGEES